MKPTDLFDLLGIGLIVVLLIGCLWWLLRTRQRTAKRLILVVLGAYVLLCVSYPSLRAYMHAQRYDVLASYLHATYPTEQFTIEFRAYKDTIQFGDFDVSNTKTPNQGVTYRVKKGGEIIKLAGSWQKHP